MNVAHVVRKQKTGGLDFYPTQPWATRALMDMFPSIKYCKVWEPACGGGHMSEVMKEYGTTVFSTDVTGYGYRGQDLEIDFLKVGRYDVELNDPDLRPDWIITNPPYGRRKAEKFALKAIEIAKQGVAMLCRNNWLEGRDRYEKLWKPHPPTYVIVFAERLGFAKGDCLVGRGGMIAYSWFVWDFFRYAPTKNLIWFPPGTKERCSRPFDKEKYGVPAIIGDLP